MIDKHKLIGTWEFNRTIVDDMAGTTTTANGTMTIDNNQWREDGVTDGRDFFQTYKVNFNTDLIVSFNDGREFYRLDNFNGIQHIDHLCGSDRYIGTWILCDNTLIIKWTVKGERKNYSMKTTYKK